MDQTSSNSSTTILLVISIAVLAIIGIGWFALESPSESPSSRQVPRVVEQEIPAATEAEPADKADAPIEPAPAPTQQAAAEPEIAPSTRTTSAERESAIDSDLRKARMAAEAEIFVEPEHQSAVYFYGRVLSAAPNHEVANAELDAVLGQLSVTTANLLADVQYEEAFELSRRVSTVRPEHALVVEVQQTLDQLSGDLVTQAMEAAEAGNDEDANTLLDEAESLPGRNARYFAAVRESVADLREAQQTAEAERLEDERAAAARATRAWMEKVRGAIADGRLIGPSGDCALEFIEERTGDDEFTEQLRGELYSAVLADAGSRIEAGSLESAEPLLAAAERIGTGDEETTELRTTLETAFLEREAARVLPITDLTRRNTVPARYPRRAEERGISGWVEVLFTVTPSGETSNVSITNSEPKEIFDEPAVEAVQQWLFEPREFRGETIAQRATAKLVFKLE